MGMFDSMGNTKLIIVHSEHTEVFANYLQLLISADDTGAAVETVVWSEKLFASNKPQLSSSDHILFIGRGSTISKECFGMTTKKSYAGMEYGWLGKRAFVRVQPQTEQEWEKLLHAAEKFDPDVGGDLIPQSRKAGIPIIKGVAALVTGPLGIVSISLSELIRSKKVSNKERGLQYKCAVLLFYHEALDDFLKG